MDIEWKKELAKTSYQLLREAGYKPITDRASGKQSYVYRITANRYPRYHIYVEQELDDYLKLHLHLDHREHGFGQRLHDTEYKGERVETEASRLQRWLNHFTVKEEPKTKSASSEDSTSIFGKLFG